MQQDIDGGFTTLQQVTAFIDHKLQP